MNKSTSRILPILFLTILTTGCIIVKEKDEIIIKETEATYEASPKSSIKMSMNYVRSSTGDMVASIPADWFFIEPDGAISSEVFAIATAPDYSMCAIFSRLKKTADLSNVVEQEGLIGLSRICYSKHIAKSTSQISLVDKYSVWNMKSQKFGYCSFVGINNNTMGSSAVFISGINEFYEFALVTMNFTTNDMPSRQVFDSTFKSILTTLKY